MHTHSEAWCQIHNADSGLCYDFEQYVEGWGCRQWPQIHPPTTRCSARLRSWLLRDFLCCPQCQLHRPSLRCLRCRLGHILQHRLTPWTTLDRNTLPPTTRTRSTHPHSWLPQDFLCCPQCQLHHPSLSLTIGPMNKDANICEFFNIYSVVWVTPTDLCHSVTVLSNNRTIVGPLFCEWLFFLLSFFHLTFIILQFCAMLLYEGNHLPAGDAFPPSGPPWNNMPMQQDTLTTQLTKSGLSWLDKGHTYIFDEPKVCQTLLPYLEAIMCHLLVMLQHSSCDIATALQSSSISQRDKENVYIWINEIFLRHLCILILLSGQHYKNSSCNVFTVD
jgi:hypothetical protein